MLILAICLRGKLFCQFMPIVWACYFQNLGVAWEKQVFFANFCLFLPVPNLLFWIDNVTFRFFANFCLFLPMPNLLNLAKFWNLRDGDSKVGINKFPPFLFIYDYSNKQANEKLLLREAVNSSLKSARFQLYSNCPDKIRTPRITWRE